MKNITVTISPLPPFVSLNFELPVEKVVKSFLSLNTNPILAGDLVAWCLQKILSDQYTEGNAAGAWSKRYPEYIEFAYPAKEDRPNDISWHESITVSAQIAEALIQYSDIFQNDNLTKAILPRLHFLKDYLKRHYNPKDRGFGLASKGKKRGTTGISVDIRHTAWAVNTLWRLQQLRIRDTETDKMLRNASGYINDELESLNHSDQYALTYASLHKILTIEGLSSIIMVPGKLRLALRHIEGVLIEKFARQYGSWDPEDLISNPKLSIENALLVLNPIQISSCIDSECSEIIKSSLCHMCEKSLIKLDDNTMALPFYEGGEPDIGATIELLWCIIKNQNVFKPEKGVVKKMINFIVDPSNRKDNLKFAYPWNLSSVLLLATEPK